MAMANFHDVAALRQETEALQGDLVKIRRHLHAHPELSGQEQQTAAFVAGALYQLGCNVREGVGGAGVVAELGTGSGPKLGLRVDMDALPIEECTGLPFASRRQGLMHACGHDIHTTVGLGVAHLMAPRAAQLPGTLRLLFQPAEEIAQGAGWMVNAGALEGLDALFGVHVYPELPVGKVGIREGTFTATSDELTVEIVGESGHGARPHEALDAIWVASQVVTGLQEAVSRRLDPLHPVVISFGQIEGGCASNVIAKRVRLKGTVRCLNQGTHHKLSSWIEKVIQGIVAIHGAQAHVDLRSITPSVVNDPSQTRCLARAACAVVGEENVEHLPQPSLGAEDFAQMLQHVPGCMFRLGVAGSEGCYPLHHGCFNPDEGAIAIGVDVLTVTLLHRFASTVGSVPLSP